jgi:hypothetical protein
MDFYHSSTRVLLFLTYGFLSHQRDSRVGSLSEFTEFWQSFCTQLNKISENSVKPEWILAELSHSSYSQDSRQDGKSSGPQNLVSLSLLYKNELGSTIRG